MARSNARRRRQTRVQARVLRFELGKDGASMVVLLLGGTKASQGRDIKRAQGFWREYLEAKRHGKAK
jgi:putative component of toxin-antitoxin plasmid stabilization module